jgi:hypothetical protein
VTRRHRDGGCRGGLVGISSATLWGVLVAVAVSVAVSVGVLKRLARGGGPGGPRRRGVPWVSERRRARVSVSVGVPVQVAVGAPVWSTLR